MVVLALEPASHLDKVHFLFDVSDGLSHLNIVEVKRVTEAAQDVVIIHGFGDSGSSFRSMCTGFKDTSSITYFRFLVSGVSEARAWVACKDGRVVLGIDGDCSVDKRGRRGGESAFAIHAFKDQGNPLDQ